MVEVRQAEDDLPGIKLLSPFGHMSGLHRRAIRAIGK
jgi:hypothetical protein